MNLRRTGLQPHQRDDHDDDDESTGLFFHMKIPIHTFRYFAKMLREASRIAKQQCSDYFAAAAATTTVAATSMISQPPLSPPLPSMPQLQRPPPSPSPSPSPSPLPPTSACLSQRTPPLLRASSFSHQCQTTVFRHGQQRGQDTYAQQLAQMAAQLVQRRQQRRESKFDNANANANAMQQLSAMANVAKLPTSVARVITFSSPVRAETHAAAERRAEAQQGSGTCRCSGGCCCWDAVDENYCACHIACVCAFMSPVLMVRYFNLEPSQSSRRRSLLPPPSSSHLVPDSPPPFYDNPRRTQKRKRVERCSTEQEAMMQTMRSMQNAVCIASRLANMCLEPRKRRKLSTL